MIAIPSHRLLIATPPACGSVSLHTALCQPRYGGVWQVGPAGDETTWLHQANQHTLVVDDASRDFFRVVILRHPAKRIMSLYRKAMAYYNPGMSFREFAGGMAGQRPLPLHWMYRWSTLRWLGGGGDRWELCPRIDLEDVPAWLSSTLGQPVELPRLNATSSGSLESDIEELDRQIGELDANSRETVQAMLDEDFQLWGRCVATPWRT